MLRVIVNTSSAGAKSYYSSGLSKDDYYTKGMEQEIIGDWGGKGAQLLGLKGTVNKDEFASLCDNLDPATGEQLTARQNENRRVGYDLNFHAPKSVSIIQALTKDENIMSAFRDSVRETMTEIEKDMQARIRTNGQNDNRTTGNLVYGEFIHTTSRPVDGVPDPHLHAHCFTFNATYDDAEGKWKAGEFGTIKKDASYFEAHFHSSFSSKLEKAGYGIERTAKGWEIAGIDRQTIEKFSNRTQEIEAIAEAKGITSDKAKDGLGARTRDKKNAELTSEELRAKWTSRLTDEETSAIQNAGEKKETKQNPALPKEEAGKAIDLALEHCLERKSVVGEREILRDALKRSFGLCAPDQVKDAYTKKEKDIIKANTKEGTVLTTKEAVKEERRLVELASEGKGKAAPINKNYVTQNEQLNAEQKQAVKHALSSKDRVIIIEGGAGTGKTTLMKELTQGCENAGKKVLAFAPSAEASRGVLQEEGFTKADTVAKLIQDKELQKQLKGNVLWIDEAGLLGNKQMNQVLELAKRQEARVILTGDTRQHTSVERGDALRIIMDKSKVKPARVTEIQRQRGNADYKTAVKLISDQKLEKGFEQLENMGAIKEITQASERHQELAREYSGLIKAKTSVLVVAPTHKESDLVTNHIRAELKNATVLKGKERTFTIHRNLSPTEAEKKDTTFYNAGQSVQFHQNAKGFARGAVLDVVGKDDQGNVLVQDSRKQEAAPMPLPLHEGKKFSVFEKAEIPIAKGDKIRITQNGFSSDKKRLNNGNIITVKGFDEAGNIVASGGQRNFVIDQNHRNFNYGYCTTSHSSQGKTVDHVLIAQSAMSFGASSREQFYVSASRGKTGISIYTDNKLELKEAIQRSGERRMASEVVALAQKKDGALRTGDASLQQQQKLVSRLATLSRVHYERAKAISQNIRQIVIKR